MLAATSRWPSRITRGIYAACSYERICRPRQIPVACACALPTVERFIPPACQGRRVRASGCHLGRREGAAGSRAWPHAPTVGRQVRRRANAPAPLAAIARLALGGSGRVSCDGVNTAQTNGFLRLYGFFVRALDPGAFMPNSKNPRHTTAHLGSDLAHDSRPHPLACWWVKARAPRSQSALAATSA